jgi:threonine/homoserine/homoserine lactone efflux protein
MDLQTWFVYLLATTGLSLSPGPNSLLALTHGALHGWRRTLFTIAGGAVGRHYHRRAVATAVCGSKCWG